MGDTDSDVLERKLPRKGIVEKVLEVSKSSDIWEALLEFDFTGIHSELEGHCFCGQPVKHRVIFTNRFTGKEIAIGENCSAHFGDEGFKLKVQDKFDRLKRIDKLHSNPRGLRKLPKSINSSAPITVYRIPKNFIRKGEIEELRMHNVIRASKYNNFDAESDFKVLDYLSQVGWDKLPPHYKVQLHYAYSIFIEPFWLGKFLSDDEYQNLLNDWKNVKRNSQLSKNTRGSEKVILNRITVIEKSLRTLKRQSNRKKSKVKKEIERLTKERNKLCSRLDNL